jgi:hypothetical protein
MSIAWTAGIAGDQGVGRASIAAARGPPELILPAMSEHIADDIVEQRTDARTSGWPPSDGHDGTAV